MVYILSRRATLKLSAGTAAAGVALVTAPAALADGHLSKAAVGYQDVPHDGKVCAQCVYFEFAPMGQDGSPKSLCKMVAGTISPSGWCEVWIAKGPSA